MDTHDHDKVIAKWLSGELSKEELIDQIPKEEAIKYIQIIGEVDQWSTGNEPMKKPELPIAEMDDTTKVIQMNRRFILSAAASVAMLLIAAWWFILRNDTVYYAAAIGETMDVVLPDGKSHVILASGSSISWIEGDWEEEHRYSSIQGTVFFEVEKGSPFKVFVDQSAVEVLGTSFEIRERAGRLAVSCFTGKVKVTGEPGSDQVIEGGESVRWTGDEFEPIDTVIVGDKPSWINGRTTFKNAPLAEVMDQLTLQFDLTFDVSQVNSERRYTGAFDHQDVNKALAAVFLPLSIQYQIKDKKVTLSE